MQVKDVTIRAQALSGTWETIGATGVRDIGVWPENVSLESDLWGSSTASFDLKRDPRMTWPDIGAWTPIDIEVGGILVWSGRVSETPTVDGTDRTISVHCTGWQFHLDDDVYAQSYVHTRISDWQDTRTFSTVSLASLPARLQVNAGNGRLIIGANNGTVWAAGTAVGVTLDLGPTALAKRVVVSLNRPAATGAATTSLFVRGHTATADPLNSSGALDFAGPTAVTSFGTSAGFVSGTIATGKRYVSIFLFNGTGYTASSDDLLQINSIQVFADATYESGNASVLKASTVVADAVTTATDLLSTDRTGIATTSFSIPDLHFPTDPKTPREVIAAVNAYQDWLPSVDVNKRICYRAKPTSPIVEVGSWAPLEVQDASANSGEDIYSRVIVTGTGPDGAPVLVTRTTTFNTLPTRRGFDRTKILPISAPLTTAMANQLGDLWLAAHTTTPYKGSYAVSGDRALRDPASGTFFPVADRPAQHRGVDPRHERDRSRHGWRGSRRPDRRRRLQAGDRRGDDHPRQQPSQRRSVPRAPRRHQQRREIGGPACPRKQTCECPPRRSRGGRGATSAATRSCSGGRS
jgi:hypothetical protein